jgi:hypothetical protein
VTGTGLPAWATARMDTEQWEAVISPGGRWAWHVHERRGLIGTEGCIVVGTQARAERVARRRLARLRRLDARIDAEYVIT